MKETDESAQALGRRIQRARKKRGWSQEEFAYLSEIDRSYMGGVERGERNVTFGKLCAIAAALECDVGKLTRGLPLPRRQEALGDVEINVTIGAKKPRSR